MANIVSNGITYDNRYCNDTLWLFNIAMEAMAHRFIDGLPNWKMVDLSMANC